MYSYGESSFYYFYLTESDNSESTVLTETIKS